MRSFDLPSVYSLALLIVLATTLICSTTATIQTQVAENNGSISTTHLYDYEYSSASIDADMYMREDIMVINQ